MTALMAYVIGCDPGKTGGLALLSAAGQALAVTAMPEIDADLFAWVTLARKRAKDDGDMIRAWVERVHASPQMGVTSAFTFGEQNGRLKMALRAAGVNYELVPPAVWQLALNCRTAGNKAVTRSFAAALFPSSKVTHATADALLIAEYGRRLCGGTPLRERRPRRVKEHHGEEQAPVQRAEDDERQREDPPEAAEAGATAGDGAGAGPGAGRGLSRPGGSAVE